MTKVLVRDVWVRLTGRDILTGISTGLGSHEVVVLAGPNGAGKTTLLSVLAGLCVPAAGHVEIAGGRPTSDVARRASGFLPSSPPLYDYLTVSEHFGLLGTLWGLREPAQVDRLVSRFGLADLLDRPAAHLSLGQRQRVSLALVTFHDPGVILLDEPFNGLDADSTNILREEIGARAAAGGCVVVATHDIAVLDGLTTRVLYLHEGRLLHDQRVDGEPASQVVEAISVERSNEVITTPDGSRIRR